MFVWLRCVKKFGSDQSWSRTSIWSKNALSGHVDFLTKKIEKSTHLGVWFGFGSSLVRPNIWFFMRLGVKTNYGRHPLRIRLLTSF